MSQYEAAIHIERACGWAFMMGVLGLIAAVCALLIACLLWGAVREGDGECLLLISMILVFISSLAAFCLYHSVTTAYKAIWTPDAYIMEIIEREQSKNIPWQPKGERE